MSNELNYKDALCVGLGKYHNIGAGGVLCNATPDYSKCSLKRKIQKLIRIAKANGRA